VTFNELKAAEVEGDAVYEAERERLREKKAQKKEKEKMMKEEKMHQIEQMDHNIQRNINRDMEKARGIYRKRPKINRNSRVKHREKYRKLLIKRKGKVQEYQEGPKGVYGGEKSGLKVGIIKSTNLS